MKILENNWMDFKHIYYFGELLFIPVWANWVATDADGSIVAFEDEPHVCENWWEDSWNGRNLMWVGSAELGVEDWTKTLVRVGDK